MMAQESHRSFERRSPRSSGASQASAAAAAAAAGSDGSELETIASRLSMPEAPQIHPSRRNLSVDAARANATTNNGAGAGGGGGGVGDRGAVGPTVTPAFGTPKPQVRIPAKRAGGGLGVPRGGRSQTTVMPLNLGPSNDSMMPRAYTLLCVCLCVCVCVCVCGYLCQGCCVGCAAYVVVLACSLGCFAHDSRFLLFRVSRFAFRVSCLVQASLRTGVCW